MLSQNQTQAVQNYMVHVSNSACVTQYNLCVVDADEQKSDFEVFNNKHTVNIIIVVIIVYAV